MPQGTPLVQVKLCPRAKETHDAKWGRKSRWRSCLKTTYPMEASKGSHHATCPTHPFQAHRAGWWEAEMRLQVCPCCARDLGALAVSLQGKIRKKRWSAQVPSDFQPLWATSLKSRLPNTSAGSLTTLQYPRKPCPITSALTDQHRTCQRIEGELATQKKAHTNVFSEAWGCVCAAPTSHSPGESRDPVLTFQVEVAWQRGSLFYWVKCTSTQERKKKAIPTCVWPRLPLKINLWQGVSSTGKCRNGVYLSWKVKRRENSKQVPLSVPAPASANSPDLGWGEGSTGSWPLGWSHETTGSASTSVGVCLSMSTFMDAIKETELF